MTQLLAQAAVQKTAALLVTGFLGSGKSHFIVRGLLPRLSPAKVVVLVNDMGEYNFDGQWMRRSGFDVLEIEGGCVCCTVGGELLAALQRIRDDWRPDWLILEGSGAADPYPLLEALDGCDYHTLGVICTVHAREAGIEDGLRLSTAWTQLRAAHTVLLTRADLVEGPVLERAHRRLATLTKAPVFASHDGIPEPDFWRFWQVDCGDRNTPRMADEPWRGRSLGRTAIKDDTRTLEGWQTKDAVERWLEALPPHVCRVKGVVPCLDAPVPLALNWTPHDWSWCAAPGASTPFLTVLSTRDPHSPWQTWPTPIGATEVLQRNAEMIPIRDWDARPGVAWAGGRPCSETEAVERLIDLIRTDPTDLALLVPPAACGVPQAPVLPHSASAWTLPSPSETDLSHMAQQIRAVHKSTLLFWGVPDALADRLASMTQPRRWFHLGLYRTLPTADISLCIRTGDQWRALGALLRDVTSAQPLSVTVD
jgi:G3E family GTPase